MEKEQTWLAEYTWDEVIRFNATLCSAQKFDCKLTPKADKARTLWEKGHPRSMSLLQALELCQECNQLRPFLFNCSNTFTSIGSDMIEGWAAQLSSLEGHMLRQTAAHFVNGQIQRKELTDLIRFLQKRPLKPVERKPKTSPPALQPVRETQPA